MAILPNSRYAASKVIVADDPLRGAHQAIEVEPPADRSFAFTYYQVEDGETADILAYRIFGKGQLWWMLADANPEILDWINLIPGTILRVPHV